MPYKDKEKKNKHHREYIAKRRADFFKDKQCLDCGSKENLQLHHRVPEEKICSRVFSWSEERRLAEIKKCDVLCRKCHSKEHAKMGSKKGEKNSQSKLKEADIPIIRKRIKSGERQIDIAKDFDVSIKAISNIKIGFTWSHIA